MQNKVYFQFPARQEGTIADNGIKYARPYIVFGNEATNASGTITMAQPSDADYLILGNIKYIFKTTLGNDPNQIKIGADLTETINNLISGVDATASGEGTSYSTGTLKNNQIEAVKDDAEANNINITAKKAGEYGNYILIDSNITGFSIIKAMSDGLDGLVPRIGKAYTFKNENEVLQGGNGIFAGISFYTGDTPNMNYYNNDKGLEVPNGSSLAIGTIASINVRVYNTIQVGYIGAYDINTGDIYGYEKEADIPENQKVIPNSKFLNGSASGELATIRIVTQ